MRANFYRPPHGFNIFKCFLQCCSTWVLSFLIISPIVSEGDWFGIHWGKFGPAANVAMCNTYSCPTGLPYSPSALVYTVGFFLPFFTILIAYLLVLPIKMKRLQCDIDRLQSNQGKIYYVRNWYKLIKTQIPVREGLNVFFLIKKLQILKYAVKFILPVGIEWPYRQSKKC